MKLGILFGILLIVLGAPLTGLFYEMVHDSGEAFRFLFAGPPLILIGLTMIFFPGGNITAMESRKKIKDPGIVFAEAPMAHKIIWVVAGIIGVIISFSFGYVVNMFS